MILTQPQLEKKCREWQKRLRLQDWDVKAVICRQREMMEEDIAGQTRWKLSIKTAAINICDPIDCPEGLADDYDMEATLVHELLHLHLAPLDVEQGTPQKVAEEQAIHAISRALVKLKREAER